AGRSPRRTPRPPAPGGGPSTAGPRGRRRRTPRSRGGRAGKDRSCGKCGRTARLPQAARRTRGGRGVKTPPHETKTPLDPPVKAIQRGHPLSTKTESKPHRLHQPLRRLAAVGDAEHVPHIDHVAEPPLPPDGVRLVRPVPVR